MTPSPEQRQLHHAAVGAEVLSAIRQLALPVIVLTLFNADSVSGALFYGAIGLVFAVAMAFVPWSTTRWQLQQDAIRLRTGVISEKIVTIPYDRVQAIDTVLGPVQRLFGVVELHVQSAGGGAQGEIILKAVTPEDAELVRQTVRGEQQPDPLAAPELPRPSTKPSSRSDHMGSDLLEGWSLGTRRLLVAAVTSGSLGVLLPVVAGASQVLDDVFGVEDAE